jgi:hypothetical protein
MRSNNVSANTVAYPTDYNTLVQDAAGAGRLLAHQMLGYFTLSTNPGNGKTLTLDINGTNVVITFVSSIGSTAGNVLIGASAAATCANLMGLLFNPTVSSATQVAIGVNTAANTTLINYLGHSLTGTTLVISSMNTLVSAPLTSFSGSTNATSDSYTASTLTLYVEPGVVYVNGTEIYFAGAVTSAVTAPSSHPRIDVLSMDNTGTLNWTTGSENVSPSAPTYPSNQIPICELYNVVGETALYDNANQQSGQGYVYNDVRPFLAYPIPLGAVPDSILPATNNTYNLGSASFQWNNIYAGTNIFVNGLPAAIAKYGGTGSDGALTATSGNTNISVSSASLFVKNYSSISITGSGSFTFTTPATNGTVILLRVTGAVTLTSSATPMLDASGMGGAGGASVSSTLGNPGNAGNGYLFPSNGGIPGNGSSAGTGGAAITLAGLANSTYSQYLSRYVGLFVGAGGASGSTGNAATTGAGGNGGGCLIIEAVGAWNFTTSTGISVGGKTGGNSVSSTGAGGAGGGGGFFLAVVGSISANTGTITISGGSAGSNSGSPTTPYLSGGGGSNVAGSTGGGGSSGAGANGVSQVVVNRVFV